MRRNEEKRLIVDRHRMIVDHVQLKWIVVVRRIVVDRQECDHRIVVVIVRQMSVEGMIVDRRIVEERDRARLVEVAVVQDLIQGLLHLFFMF